MTKPSRIHQVLTLSIVSGAIVSMTVATVAFSGVAGERDAAQVNFYEGRGTPSLDVEAGDADDIIAATGDFAEGRITISSTQGVEPANERAIEDCTQLSPTELECEGLFNGQVIVSGGAGADLLNARIIGDSEPFGGAPVALDGGQGRDELLGSRGPDAIAGGPGRDVERGRGGDDELGYLRDPARDRFSGGGGDDRIFASRGAKDRLIDCGEGDRDRATRDRFDAKAIDCEKVERG